MVYVISKSGKPLMPTRRHGKVRRLLKSMIVKPAKRTYLAHKYGLVSDIHTGDTVKYEKHNRVKGNVKQNVFVATGIRILSSKVISYAKANQNFAGSCHLPVCLMYTRCQYLILAPCIFMRFIHLT